LGSSPCKAGLAKADDVLARGQQAVLQIVSGSVYDGVVLIIIANDKFTMFDIL